MHISLVLVLYEGVAAWLPCVRILDEMNALDRSELLELPPGITSVDELFICGKSEGIIFNITHLSFDWEVS